MKVEFSKIQPTIVPALLGALLGLGAFPSVLAERSSEGAPRRGSIAFDGSSVVFPIAEVMAEEFIASGGTIVTVGISGSGGGLKKFCFGDIDLAGTARPIRQREIDFCAEEGIEFVELPIAYDDVIVVANAKNDWARCVTIDELKTIWEPAAQGAITNWNQIRGEYPDKELRLFGPSTDASIYDYFTKVVTGEEGTSRGDFTASDSVRETMGSIGDSEGGLGFLNYLDYKEDEENEGRLKVLEIDSGNGCVAPSPKAIANATYVPFSRPLFVYANKESLERPEVKAFVEFFLAKENQKYILEVSYLPLPAKTLSRVRRRFRRGTTGSVFGGEGARAGISVREALR